MKNVLSAFLAGFTIFQFGCSAVTKTDYHVQQETAIRNIDLQGHRGARSALPENTLAAFEYAMRIGVDTLELDTGVTMDDVVVVSHDQKPNPKICQYKDGSKLRNPKWIYQTRLAELKTLDCGSKPNPRFPKQSSKPGSEIPTLAEVFELVTQSQLPNAQTIRFNIETKSDPRNPDAQPDPEHFAKQVLAVIEKYDFKDRVTLQSFDHRTLREAKRLSPDIELAALFRTKPKDWVQSTKDAEADIVSPYFKLLDEPSVRKIQAAGLRVIPWTPNKKRDWNKLINMGVDGIITDDPELLIKHIRRPFTEF